MKTKLLPIALLALFATTKQSQASEVFPTSDAIWVIQVYPETDHPHQYVYALFGDTVINNCIYQKLYLLSDTTLIIGREDIYVAGIRQTPEKQVWIQPADKHDGTKFEEYLMYDFGKDVGEEINFGKSIRFGMVDSWGPTFDDVGQWDIIERVSRIEEISENEYGFVYYVGYPFREYWVEGIGSLSGLFYIPISPVLGGGFIGAKLICMKEHGEVKFLGEYCTSCFNESGVSIIPTNLNNNLSVYYNSSQNCIEIESKNGYFESEFNLMSIDGRIVLQNSIQDTYTSINVSYLPKGVYIYSLVGDNINQSGKLIIK